MGRSLHWIKVVKINFEWHLASFYETRLQKVVSPIYKPIILPSKLNQGNYAPGIFEESSETPIFTIQFREARMPITLFSTESQNVTLKIIDF